LGTEFPVPVCNLAADVIIFLVLILDAVSVLEATDHEDAEPDEEAPGLLGTECRHDADCDRAVELACLASFWNVDHAADFPTIVTKRIANLDSFLVSGFWFLVSNS